MGIREVSDRLQSLISEIEHQVDRSKERRSGYGDSQLEREQSDLMHTTEAQLMLVNEDLKRAVYSLEGSDPRLPSDER